MGEKNTKIQNVPSYIYGPCPIRPASELAGLSAEHQSPREHLRMTSPSQALTAQLVSLHFFLHGAFGHQLSPIQASSWLPGASPTPSPLLSPKSNRSSRSVNPDASLLPSRPLYLPLAYATHLSMIFFSRGRD